MRFWPMGTVEAKPILVIKHANRRRIEPLGS